MTAELERAARPADPTGVLERVNRRRSRRASLRKVQAGLLAVAVLAATAGGFLFLRDAFDTDKRKVGDEQSPTIANGEIVFAKEDGDGRTHIFAARPDGSSVRRITEGGTTDSGPMVSPDGRTVAFVRVFEEFRQRIATVGIDGGEVIYVSEDYMRAEDPAWSPDGRTLVYVTTGIDSQQLYSIDLETRQTSDVIDFFGALADPSWSADGTKIAFAGRGYQGVLGNGSWDLATVVPGAGKREIEPLLVTGGDEEASAWSPDGTRIAFTRRGAEGDEVWTIDPDGGSETLLATAVDASLEPDLAWAPDGTALLISDGEWIYRIDATPSGDPRGNFVQLVKGRSPAWQPLPAGSEPSPTSEPKPNLSPSPSPAPEDSDIGLGFNVCNLAVLSGIDFLGDGTNGTAWTATKVEPNGKCPSTNDGTNGVAVDFTGDGEADSWSETIEHCTMCGPFMARDLNEDGAQEVIITLQGGSIMQYGIYAVMSVDTRLQVVPFRTGEPGHEDAGHAVGEPFTFWVGGDEGSSYWFHCEALPEFRLTDTYTPVDGGANAETTVHETHVSLGTDGIAEILDAQTYTVSEVVVLQYATSKPDCGLGVDIWRLQAPA